MSETKQSDLKAGALGAFNFAAAWTDQTLDGFDESTRCETCEHNPNHAAWTAGHLAYTYDSVLAKLTGAEPTLGERWNEQFGMGSKPASDPPPLAELRETLSTRRKAFAEWFASLPDEQVAEPLPEDWRFFGETHAGMMGALGAHETFHAGQLNAIRKKLNLGPVFG